MQLLALTDTGLPKRFITPQNGVLSEKLTGPKLIKKFPVFDGNRRLMTLFAKARHLPVSEPQQSGPCLPIPPPEDPL